MPPVSVTIFASDPGTYFLEDDGIPGNNFSRIRFPDGTVVPFEHPTDDLFFTPSVAGVTLVVNFIDSLGTARLTAGNLTDPLQTPDLIQVKNLVTTAGVTLVSNGAIVELSADAAADIIAATVVLSAVTGVGTTANALETQVGTLEAETAIGGVNLRNFGTVAIGGLTDEVDGLDVITSGNLLFTNFGAIVLSDDSGPETVHGGTTSGNVTLTANGVDSDIISNIDQDSISAPRGNITVTAGRDVGFGLIGTNFDNDVRANGTITINAGRDFLMDGFADMVSDDFGQSTGGDVIINAGRNIALLAVAGTDAGIQASGSAGANVILNTGPGGTVTLNSGNGTAPFASLISSSGDVVVNADRISIGTNGAISTPSGQVTIQPISEGWDIDLGSATDVAFALELSDAELDRIFTPTLNIGSLDSGQLNVTVAISPLNALDLILRAGTDIGITAGMTIGGALTLRAGNNIFQLPASAITLGAAFNAFVDEVGDDGFVGGSGLLNGFVSATQIKLNGNADEDTLSGTASEDILNGFGGADVLRGFGGGDTLDGGTGKDEMIGGFGDDVYIADLTTDVVTEGVGEGLDAVLSAATFTLSANVENLTLTGTADINGSGNDLDNTIFGNSGVNTLDGKIGADSMRGGGGNDTYVVNDAGDAVIENAAAGTDQVNSSVTFTLGANVENLTLTGGSAIDATGNTLANILTGNGNDNRLDGAGGADTMVGGFGDDTYVVNIAGDILTEAAAAGTDTVESAIDFTLAANFEDLVLVGGAVNGTGNTAANVITGNTLANTLNGDAGGDTLNGGVGIDTLNGGTGNDHLFGGTGNDDLTGGANVDKFYFDTALNVVTNVDDILDFSVADDAIQLDRDIFAGIAADGTLSAAAFRAGTTAVDADDRIIYDAATGQIFYDSDGVGGAAQILFATVTAGTALTRLDFIAYTD